MHVPLQLDAERSSFIGSQMSKWVDEVLGPSFHRYRAGRTWHPAINLYEDASNYCLVVDLAGMDADSIDLRVEKNYLILKGDRPTPRPPQCDVQKDPQGSGTNRLHLMEIDHGVFQRRLKLPEGVNAKKVEARYEKGFLWVRMPKKS